MLFFLFIYSFSRTHGAEQKRKWIDRHKSKCISYSSFFFAVFWLLTIVDCVCVYVVSLLFCVLYSPLDSSFFYSPHFILSHFELYVIVVIACVNSIEIHFYYVFQDKDKILRSYEKRMKRSRKKNEFKSVYSYTV